MRMPETVQRSPRLPSATVLPPPLHRALPLLVLATFLAGMVGAGLKGEFGPVPEWACAWSADRSGVAAPDVRGLPTEAAREALATEGSCLRLRVAGERLDPAQPGTVLHQSVPPGEPMGRRLDVVVAATR
jgi:hypothetical protein